MWSDTLQHAEYQHLVRLFVWSEASLLVGGVMLAVLIWRRVESPLLRHFAIQTAAWGAVSLLLAYLSWRRLTLRDHAGAVRLDRTIWLNIGLDIGYVAVGATLALTGWYAGRRIGPVGAGLAIVTQGIALGLLDWAFAQQIAR